MDLILKHIISNDASYFKTNTTEGLHLIMAIL